MLFVEADDRDAAYRDSALAIACGQTISQPFVVAYMTEQLQLQKNAPRARDRHRLGLSGGGAVAALPARSDHRAIPDARGSRSCPAGETRLSQCRGDARRRPRPACRSSARSTASSSPRRWSRFRRTLLRAAGARRHPDRAGRSAARRQTLVRFSRTDAGIRAQGTGRRPLRAGAARDGAGAVDSPDRLCRQHLIGRVKPLFTGGRVYLKSVLVAYE